MWIYAGHTAIIALRDGTTFRGKVGWSWIVGHWLLRDVQLVDDEDRVQGMVGKTLIPRASVSFVQVM